MKGKKIPPEEIENQIELHHKYLEGFERIENDELPPELVKLRNHVLFVHSSIESLLHFLICSHVASSFGWTKSNPTATLSLFKVQPFLEEVDYYRLIKTCLEEKIISKDTYNKLLAVNNHRVRFAHQNAKKKEIEDYKERSKYLEALRDLSKGLTAIVTAWDEFSEEQSLYKRKIDEQIKLSPDKK